MKYYSLVRTLGNNPTIPGMNGAFVKNKDLFFDTGEMGANKFYDNDYEFNYLTPLAFGDPAPEAEIIADYHNWHGEDTPWGGITNIISKKLKDILESFNLSASKFYNAKVLFQDEFYPYFVWQVLQDEYKPHFDFKCSEFNNLTYNRTLEQDKLEIRKFNSMEELDTFSEKNWGFSWNYEQLVLKPSFRELDFCIIPNLNFIVSERLKEACEQKKIFGLTFEESAIEIKFSDEI